MIDIGTHKWEEVFENLDPHAKAEKYHETLITKLNKHLKEKTVNMTSLDKTWFSPILKLKYNEMQNEYFKHGKSEKWRKLRSNFRRSKRKASKSFYKEFVKDLKVTKPGQYHKLAKRIGAINQQNGGDLKIECLEGLDPQLQVEAVAESFAKVSNEYNPIDLQKLPAYLPAEEPPQINV